MQGIKELLEDARKAIGAYLNRGNTDGIIVVLIKKYHDFLTDDERLALIDPQEKTVPYLGYLTIIKEMAIKHGVDKAA